MDEEQVAVTPSTEPPPLPEAAPPKPDPRALAEQARLAADEALAQSERAQKALDEAKRLAKEQAAADALKLREELAAAEAIRARLDEREARDAEKRRVAYLRGIGLRSDVISDADALILAPKVDPTTPEGIAAIDAWREANPGKFNARPDTLEALKARITSSIPDAPNRKLYGDAFREQQIKKHLELNHHG